MLKQRLVTALIGGAVVIWGVLTLPAWAFAIAVALVMLVGAWEWGALLQMSDPRRLVYCALVAALIVLLWWWRPAPVIEQALLMTAGLFWVLVVVWLGRFSRQPNSRSALLTLAVVGFIVLVVPWFALVNLHGSPSFGSVYILVLLSLVWIADSGAYFAGRLWGRRKLAPQISPGKTWAGAYGAVVCGLIIAVLAAYLLKLAPAQWPAFLVVAVATVVISIIGDLFESMIKRQSGVKDSGSLLPGHGGVLDRIDSLTAAAPVFFLGMYFVVDGGSFR